MWKTLDEKTLKSKKVADLREIARTFGLEGYEKMKKAELIENLMKDNPEEKSFDDDTSVRKAADEAVKEEGVMSEEAPKATSQEEEKTEIRQNALREGREGNAQHHKNKVTPDKDDRFEVEGILELADDGFGFLRFNNFLTSEKDIYVAPAQIRRFNSKTGDKIKGICRHPNDGNRFGALLYVVTVNGDEPGVAIKRPDFDTLTPIFPNERFILEDGRELSLRLIDLVAPVGKGQRGLIVAPPKAGKTVLLKKIANSIEKH